MVGILLPGANTTAEYSEFANRHASNPDGPLGRTRTERVDSSRVKSNNLVRPHRRLPADGHAKRVDLRATEHRRTFDGIFVVSVEPIGPNRLYCSTMCPRLRIVDGSESGTGPVSGRLWLPLQLGRYSCELAYLQSPF